MLHPPSGHKPASGGNGILAALFGGGGGGAPHKPGSHQHGGGKSQHPGGKASLGGAHVGVVWPVMLGSLSVGIVKKNVMTDECAHWGGDP